MSHAQENTVTVPTPGDWYIVDQCGDQDTRGPLKLRDARARGLNAGFIAGEGT